MTHTTLLSRVTPLSTERTTEPATNHRYGQRVLGHGRWLRATLCAASLLALPATAWAEDASDSSSPLPIEIHAFVSQGFIKTTSNNYLAEDSTHGCRDAALHA
jgi:hypothetical protein